MTDHEDRWVRIGKAIEERRKKLGLTKAELLRTSGLSFGTLRDYIAGQPIVREDKARDLALALGWPPNAIDLLLQGTDPARLDRIAARAEAGGGTPRDAIRSGEPPDPHFNERLVNEIEHLQKMVAWLEDAVEELRDNDREDVVFSEKPVSMREHAANAMGGQVLPLKPRRPPVDDEDEGEDVPLAADSDLSPAETQRAVKGARKRSKPTGADIEPGDQ